MPGNLRNTRVANRESDIATVTKKIERRRNGIPIKHNTDRFAPLFVHDFLEGIGQVFFEICVACLVRELFFAVKRGE